MIKLITITNKQMLCEAFGITDKQATAMKNEIMSTFVDANTWTECIEKTLSDDDTQLVEAFKMLTIGELMGMTKK